MSTFAVLSGRVCIRSWGKIAEELGASFPFSHVPPSLWSIARPKSCAISDDGRTMTIAPQTSLRHSVKQAPAFFPHQLLSARVTRRSFCRLLPRVITTGGL